jgi:hypothetical protein
MSPSWPLLLALIWGARSRDPVQVGYRYLRTLTSLGLLGLRASSCTWAVAGRPISRTRGVIPSSMPFCVCLRAPDRRNDRNKVEGARCARPSAMIIGLVLAESPPPLKTHCMIPRFTGTPGGYFSMATGNKLPSDLVVSLLLVHHRLVPHLWPASPVSEGVGNPMIYEWRFWSKYSIFTKLGYGLSPYFSGLYVNGDGIVYNNWSPAFRSMMRSSSRC